MSLTPMEIHNRDFPKSFRGYNEDQVDQFLDEIVEDFERLYKENQELKEKLGLLGDQLNQYKTIENTLKETLVTAQKAADEVVAAAQKKAELIIDEAEGQARKIIENANNDVIRIKRESDELKKDYKIFKNRFKTFLEMQLEEIEDKKLLFEEE